MMPLNILADIGIDPQVIVAVLFLLFGGLKWLVDKFKGSQEIDDGSDLEDIYEQYREQIRERQTTTHSSDTPAPIQRQTPTPTSPPPLPVSQPASRRPATVSEYKASHSKEKPRLTAAERAALEKIKDSDKHLSTSPRRRRKVNAKYARLLASPESARQAIVLSEVLGPPKALR